MRHAWCQSIVFAICDGATWCTPSFYTEKQQVAKGIIWYKVCLRTEAYSFQSWGGHVWSATSNATSWSAQSHFTQSFIFQLRAMTCFICLLQQFQTYQSWSFKSCYSFSPTRSAAQTSLQSNFSIQLTNQLKMCPNCINVRIKLKQILCVYAPVCVCACMHMSGNKHRGPDRLRGYPLVTAGSRSSVRQSLLLTTH